MKKHKLDLTEAFWKNAEYVDATEPLKIFPHKVDLEKAVPGDPEHFVYAECLRRVLPGARRVRIWRNVALVERKGIVYRYIISHQGRRALTNFDRGVGEAQPCTLLPPTASTRLDAKIQRERKLSPQQRELRRIRAEQIYAAKKAGAYKPAFTRKPIEIGMRSGTGHHAYAH